MNIKHAHNKSKNQSITRPKSKDSKLIKNHFQAMSKTLKSSENIQPLQIISKSASLKISDKIILENRISPVPPSLERQNTDQSQEKIYKFKKNKESHNREKQALNKQKNNSNLLLSSKKFLSDEESTNVCHNKQRNYQYQNPYKSSLIYKAHKQKIEKSRNLSISIVCNELQKNNLIESQRLYKSTKKNKNQKSLKKLGSEIKKQISTVKSLAHRHQIQNQYYVKTVGITNQERKRLTKIHFIELNKAQSQIFQLGKKLQAKLRQIN